MERIAFIREEERKYHEHCYDHYTLFTEGTWLHKPVKIAVDLMEHFKDQENVNVLDLGCGIGRNAIPIAEKIKGRKGKVVCVDLLDSALRKLKRYSKEYGVNELIQTEQADIGKYAIKRDEYDYIVAVSSLEHVHSVDVLEEVVQNMVEGTKNKGINFLIVNSNIEEVDLESSEKRDALVEINLATEEIMSKLNNLYEGWEQLSLNVKPIEYSITRNEKPFLFKSNAIIYAVRRKK